MAWVGLVLYSLHIPAILTTLAAGARLSKLALLEQQREDAGLGGDGSENDVREPLLAPPRPDPSTGTYPKSTPTATNGNRPRAVAVPVSNQSTVQPQWAAYVNGGGAVSPALSGSPIPDAEVGPPQSREEDAWQRPSQTSNRGSLISTGLGSGAAFTDPRTLRGVPSMPPVNGGGVSLEAGRVNGGGGGSGGSFAGFVQTQGVAAGSASLLTGQNLAAWEKEVVVNSRDISSVSSHKLSMSVSPPALAWEAPQQQQRGNQ